MVTGRGALYLTDAVARSEKISGYSLHHEQSAVFAAAAYADYSDGIGCCVVSTGCGSTNAITGVLNAWQDGIPVLILSGQHELEETTNYMSSTIDDFRNFYKPDKKKENFNILDSCKKAINLINASLNDSDELKK